MSSDPSRPPRRPLTTTPLSERPSKVCDSDLARPVPPDASLADFLDSLPDLLAVRAMREVAAAVLAARAAGKPVILGCGAHVVKAGLSPLVIDWLERGLVTGIAVNGAFVLHDSEIALGGATSENVEEALPGGTFGVTAETNGFVNAAVAARGPELGVGAAVGQALAAREDLVRPEHSVTLACARLGLPLTVTVAIGTDVNHMHPDFDGAAWGAASLRDFDTFVDEVSGLDAGGVFLLAGSAVLLPEVLLKALAMLANAGKAPRGFVSADFDMLPHYRALTQVVDRPRLFGAKTYFVQAPHELSLPVLGAMLGGPRIAAVDSSRLKRIDKYLGTFLVLVLAALEWVRRLFSPSRRRAGTDLTHLKRIAVIKTVAIGDVLQALPTVKALRERFPDARLEFITTPRVREVVDGIPFVDEIVYYDVFGKHSGIGGVWRFARELRARHYDAWIELEHYYRFTTVIGWFTGAKVRVGFAIPGQVRRFLFTIGAPYPTDAHELDSFLSIARALGAVVEHPEPVPVPTSSEDERITREWIEASRAELPPAQRAQGLVVLHTTTSPVSIGRRWMSDRWVELADRIAERYGLTAVWTGAPEDLPGLRQLAERTSQPSLISAGALSLRQFSVLAGLAKLVVSVDTGPLHVAAATGTPTVAMFGPSDMRKWRPYGPGNVAVSAGLSCSPCTTHYMGKISLKTCDDCMRAISVDRVMEAIESLPARPPVAGRKDEA